MPFSVLVELGYENRQKLGFLHIFDLILVLEASSLFKDAIQPEFGHDSLVVVRAHLVQQPEQLVVSAEHLF